MPFVLKIQGGYAERSGSCGKIIDSLTGRGRGAVGRGKSFYEAETTLALLMSCQGDIFYLPWI